MRDDDPITALTRAEIIGCVVAVGLLALALWVVAH